MGIKHLTIDGSMSMAKRTKILQQFRDSGVDGPRVLIISKVGATGLNLAHANILISLVSSTCSYTSGFPLQSVIATGNPQFASDSENLLTNMAGH